MTILEYYRNKQSDLDWVADYQSTAQDKHGKLFNCINVNFRSLNCYYDSLSAFKDKDGLKRSEWNDTQKCGQEQGKQWIQPFTNAGLIEKINDRYFITKKGKCVLLINDFEDLSDKEKSLLIYMLLLDYKFGEKDIDIIKTVAELSSDLEEHGYTASKLISLLKDAINVEDKKVLFTKDIFWLITFAKDDAFVDTFKNSSQEEKEQLSEWVLSCSKNKDTTDCIAHKFIGGGAYTGKMFNEDINIILNTLILLTLQDKDYNNFISIISRLRGSSIRVERIQEIITDNKEIFDSVYKYSIGKINDLLNVED